MSSAARVRQSSGPPPASRGESPAPACRPRRCAAGYGRSRGSRCRPARPCADHVQDACRLLHAQRGGRFVEEQQSPAPERGLADRDDLALTARHGVDRRVEVGEPRRKLGDRVARPSASRACAGRRTAQARRPGRARDRGTGWPSDRTSRPGRGPGRRSRPRPRARRPANRIRGGCPRGGSRPSLGRRTPAMHLTRVDLPAPLSPTRPTTSPRRISKLTSLSASTAP